MKRREFIKNTGLLSLTPVTTTRATTEGAGLTASTNFPASIMRGSTEDASGPLDIYAGALPDDIYGHVFVAEGVPLEINHFSPNGKGMITRLDFNDGQPGFLRKAIKTPSALIQNKLDGWLDKFYLFNGTSYLSPNLGFMNYCNTAPFYVGDNRYTMTYEGGIPFEFDASTLEVVSPIGHIDEWLTSLPPFAEFFTPNKWIFPQVRTTAHPYFDYQRGECFTLNYGGNIGTSSTQDGFIDLLQWDFIGALKRWRIVDRQGTNAYFEATSHSFGVTRHFIILFETAARVEANRLFGGTNIDPQRHTTPTWIIRKSDLATSENIVVADKVLLDFDTSDLMVDYDDNGGEITIYGHYLGAMDKSEPSFSNEKLLFGGNFPENLAGYPVSPLDVSGLVRARIQVKDQSAQEIKSDFKVIRDARVLWDVNDPAYRDHFRFPEKLETIYYISVGFRPELLVQRVSDAYSDYPNRLYRNEDLPKTDIPSALVRLDCASMTLTDTYSFPDDAVVRTTQFMEKRHSSTQSEGYILCCVVRKHPSTASSNGKEFWIFDGENLSQGPVCILGHTSLDFATTNHALWSGSANPRPRGAYKASLADYFLKKRWQHSRDVRRLIDKELLPRFG